MSCRKENDVSSSYDDTIASSSGIVDSDVTILGYTDVRNTVDKIETELGSRGYTVAIPLCGGRSIMENLISRVLHAKITVIILTKKTEKDFQAFLDVLPPPPNPGSLKTRNTIIFYEDGLNKKRIRRRFANIIRMKLPKDAQKICIEISCFLEAVVQSEHQRVVDLEDHRNRYASLLIHSIINPLRSIHCYALDAKELEERFTSKYGLFENFLVGEMPEFLRISEGFTTDAGKIGQTHDGACLAYEWFDRVTHAAELRREPINVDTPRDSPTLISDNVSPQSTSNQTVQQARTDQWVSESNATLPQELSFDKEVIEPLAKHLNEFDSRYTFFLLSGKLDSSKELQCIVNVPWLKVIDFDTNSRKEGLLHSVENILRSKRGFSISTTTTSSTRPLLDSATDWFFPQGYTDRPDTMCEGDPLQWYTANRVMFEQQCSVMADFCNCRTLPVFLILWYNCSENDTKCLDWFLSVLHLAFTSETLLKKVIVCVDEYPENNSALNHLICNKYQLKATTVKIPISSVCKWLAQAKTSQLPKPGVVKLPMYNDGHHHSSGTVEISSELIWIKEFIEVLPLENLDEVTKRKTDNAGMDFVKGGTITWDELATGKIAVYREVLDKVNTSLKADVLEEKKSIVIKIRHTPGGGGTTFARQLLWHLHSDVPCGVVVPNPTLSITHLMERVEFLHDKTLLPIVLLVDGRSDYEVEQLYESCKYAIVILHVQRHNLNIKNKYNPTKRTCHLPGFVTEKEADKLTQVFSEFAPKSSKLLASLTEDVKRDKKRFIFEYGLTAFNHEFMGVRSYVHGYMELQNKGIGIQKLDPWQKVVTDLSLVSYYAQGGMHREIFHKTLKENQDDTFVTLDNLKYSGRQFILESNGEWKISYYVVAKEILEQVLSVTTSPENQASLNLSEGARTNLHQCVIDFIIMLKTAMKNTGSECVMKLLSDMILRRDYRDMDMSDAYGKKHSLSRLLEDIPDGENRIKILRELTNAFPQYVEFHAHLGRLLNLMERFEDAEKSLQTALDIRNKERRGTDPTWKDSVRGRIHHMFGFGFILRAKRELKNAKQPSPIVESTLMSYARKAVGHFQEGRQYETHNLSYGYIGEVRARLLIAEYVHKMFPRGCLMAFSGDLGRDHAKLSEFIQESHSICDQLLAECHHYTPELQLRKINDYFDCVQKFNIFFKEVTGNLTLWGDPQTNIPMRRSQIASLKMSHRSVKNDRVCIDNISDKKDILKIIKLYEKTFHEVLFNDIRYIFISVDMLEWLEAIRHNKVDDTYTLISVLNTVIGWESRNEIGYATFYLYVINFVLSVYSPGQDMNMEYNNNAKELREKLKTKKHRYLKQRFSLEWLAKHDELTIRKLVCRNKLGAWDKENRFWKESEAINQLQVCTGTIIKSTHPLSGTISLDVPNPRPRHRVEVKFVPKLYNLTGSRFAEQSLRVEFFVGFSADHGAEALSIRKLNRAPCRSCKIDTETITLNQEGKRKCSKCGHCEKIHNILAENFSFFLKES